MTERTSNDSLHVRSDRPTSPGVEVSVVVPVFNEAENIESLCHEIVDALAKTERGFEVLFVDDASTDASAERLAGLHVGPCLRVLRHERNYGQSAAVATGFRHARGWLVATLDGDGQNDPSDLPRLLEHLLATGADCVTGVRAVRADRWLKRAASRVGNRFRDWVTGDRVSDSGCGIRVVRREALAEVPIFNGMHRFLPTLLRAQGLRVEELVVNHRPRARGVSKYGLSDRLWRGLRDCFAVRWYLSRAIPAARIETREGKP